MFFWKQIDFHHGNISRNGAYLYVCMYVSNVDADTVKLDFHHGNIKQD